MQLSTLPGHDAALRGGVVDARPEGGRSGLVLVRGALLVVGFGVLCALLILVLLAGEGQGVAVLEVKGGQFEPTLGLPDSEPNDVLELLLGEEDVEHALQHYVLLPHLLRLLLDDLSLLLVLVLHLEDLLRCRLVLLPQLVQQLLHLLHLLL